MKNDEAPSRSVSLSLGFRSRQPSIKMSSTSACPELKRVLSIQSHVVVGHVGELSWMGCFLHFGKLADF